MREAMRCEYACAYGHEPAGLRDCCHTCSYFLGEECRAPEGFGFFPRVLWRIAIEA